jgi:hypothetical protein
LQLVAATAAMQHGVLHGQHDLALDMPGIDQRMCRGGLFQWQYF